MKTRLPYIKDFLKRADMTLFCLGLISAVFGLIVISSAAKTLQSGHQYILIQLVALLVGIALFVFLTIIDLDILAENWIFIFIFSAALILALVPFGQNDATGNSAWIRFFGIGIQPAEIVKVTYIILLGRQAGLYKNSGTLSSPFSVVKTAAQFIFFFGLIVVVSADLGSALVYLFIFLAVMFAAGLRLYWFAAALGAVAAITPFLWTHVLRNDQKNRILAPYVPGIDPTGDGISWQANQFKLGLASGQLTGEGLYNGTQAQSNLPAKQTDFIFGVIGEELGMIGCLLVIALEAAIIIRCVYIGIKSKNNLNMLVCMGVAAMFFFQTFENIGMCMGIAPVIGITLPLFSYGGSSLFSLFAALGLVSGVKFRPKPERFRSY